MYPFRFNVSLRMMNFDMPPDEICRELEMEPERAWRKGEPRTTPIGRPLKGIREQSYCTFAITKNENEALEDLLAREIDTLFKFKELFQRIRQEGGKTEFFIGLYVPSNSGCTLNSSLLKHLADLQIDLALDIYGGE